jgi:hypothetical protein
MCVVAIRIQGDATIRQIENSFDIHGTYAPVPGCPTRRTRVPRCGDRAPQASAGARKPIKTRGRLPTDGIGATDSFTATALPTRSAPSSACTLFNPDKNVIFHKVGAARVPTTTAPSSGQDPSRASSFGWGSHGSSQHHPATSDTLERTAARGFDRTCRCSFLIEQRRPFKAHQ